MEQRYWVYQTGESIVFMLDSSTIINKLPTTTSWGDLDAALFRDNAKPVGPGSMAICADDGSTFILDSNGQWNAL